MNGILDLLGWLGAFGIGAGGLAYLVRALFSQLLSRDLEKFRADLQRAAFEHEVRFGQLHAKRAEVMATLYELLVNTQEAIVLGIRLGGSRTDPEAEGYRKAAQEAARALTQYFRRNRFYLPRDLCDHIAAAEANFFEAWHSNMAVLIELDGETTQEDREYLVGLRRRIREVLKVEVPLALGQIETSIRAILGDEDAYPVAQASGSSVTEPMRSGVIT